jgi:hypothetical protein
MQLVTIHDEDTKKHYLATVSRQWAIKNDNGALISCGLTINEWTGHCDITRNQLEWLRTHNRLKEITAGEANHSGCQSRCVMRGDAICQW